MDNMKQDTTDNKKLVTTDNMKEDTARRASFKRLLVVCDIFMKRLCMT